LISIEMNLKEQGRREKPLTFMWMNLIGRLKQFYPRKTADFHVDEPDRKIKTVLSDSSSRLPPRDLALILKNSVRNI